MLTLIIAPLSLAISSQQSVASTQTGPHWYFGTAILGVADLNNDATPDFYVSDPGVSEYGAHEAANSRGTVWLLSGRDGSTIRTLESAELDDGFGFCLASCGDLNGDGVEELVVGSLDKRPGAMGYASVFDGRSGERLFRLSGSVPGELFGCVVASVHDLNRDGKPDIAVGACDYYPDDNSNPGRVSFFSGADGALLYQRVGTENESWFGRDVLGIGDVDGNGLADAFVARQVKGETRRLEVISPQSGDAIWSSTDVGGHSFCAEVDFNGDGIRDVIAGHRLGLCVLSGKDGVVLQSWKEPVNGPITVLEHATKDRVLSLLLSDPEWGIGTGIVKVFSTASGEVTRQLRAPFKTWHFGASQAVIGDLDGDAFADFAVGSDTVRSQEGEIGVWLFSGRTGEVLMRLQRKGDEVQTLSLSGAKKWPEER